MPLLQHRALWALTAGQRGRYGGAMLLMALETVLNLTPPLVVLATIDGILGKDVGSALGQRGAALAEAFGADTALWIAAGAVVALTGSAGVCLALRGRWAALASESIVRDLRDALYRRIERLPCATHDRADTGDLVQRCSSDVETLRVFLATQVVEIGRAALLVLAATPILASLDGPLALAATVLFPVIVAYALLCFRPIRHVFQAMDEAEAVMTSVLQENLTGIRVVRAFGRQAYERERFAVAAARFRDRNTQLIRLLANYWGGSDLLCFTQLALSLFVGAQRFLAGELSLGTLVAFQTILALVIWPLRQSGRVLADSGKAVVALDRIEEVLEQAEETGASARPRADHRGLALSARDLRFAYGDGPAVLAGLDVELAPGQTLALVGPPGAGKSSFVSLLLRLYDGYTGSLTVDGVELRELDRAALRSRIAVVLQEPFLYARSVADNLRRARAEASDDELHEALVAADLEHSVAAFPDGLETLIGERGVTLSGGQRQRLAIARAWLRDAPLMILDDALSAVDTATEERILQALSARRGRCTTVLIAQRLSSVAHADQIVVLDGGRVLQSGTHAELLRQGGAYARLWAIQAGLEAELHEAHGAGAGDHGDQEHEEAPGDQHDDQHDDQHGAGADVPRRTTGRAARQEQQR